MSPFEPLGEFARWRTLYNLVQTKAVDETLTYEEMATATKLDPVQDRTKIQLAFRRAAKELAEQDYRATEAVPNVGYRVVRAPEQLRLARTQQSRADMALVKGKSLATHVDFNGLAPEVRGAFEMTARAFGVLIDYSRRLDIRQQQLAQALDSMTNRQDRSEAEVEALKQRLARIESNGIPPAS